MVPSLFYRAMHFGGLVRSRVSKQGGLVGARRRLRLVSSSRVRDFDEAVHGSEDIKAYFAAQTGTAA